MKGIFLPWRKNQNIGNQLLYCKPAAARELPRPVEPSGDTVLLCVIHGRRYDSCAVVLDKSALRHYDDSRDERRKRWFLVRRSWAQELLPELKKHFGATVSSFPVAPLTAGPRGV